MRTQEEIAEILKIKAEEEQALKQHKERERLVSLLL